MWVALVVLAPCLALFAGTIRLVGTRRLSLLRQPPRPSAPAELSVPPLPTPEPLTPEQLPPALLSLLVHHGDVQSSVIAETVLDLVRTGWLRSEHRDDGSLSISLTGQPGPEPLRPFETLVMQRFTLRAGRLARVPLSALGRGEGKDYGPWWKSFEQSVRDEAVALGLLLPEASRAARVAADAVTGVACAGFGFLYSRVIDVSGSVEALLVFLTWFVLLNPIREAATRTRLSASGRRASAALGGMQFDGRRSEGISVVHGPLVDRAAASGEQPPSADLPPDQVWSSYGGRWRVVQVGRLKGPPGGGPANLFLLTAVAAVSTVALALLTHGRDHRVLTALPAVLLALRLIRWVPAFRRRLARPTEAVFPGVVVRLWAYPVRSDERASARYCCSVDDGDATSWSFTIGRVLWDRLRVGDTVEVRCNPRWHRLDSITPIVPVPPAPGSTDTVPSDTV
jgi:hypothetical protein